MRKPILDASNIVSVHGAVTAGGTRCPAVGRSYEGSTRWTYANGKPAGSIGHTVTRHDEESGTLVLDFLLNDRPVRQTFRLLGRPCRYGGRRWLAVCPVSGRAVAKLYGLAGLFHSRHVLVASYRSQDRIQPTDKLRSREFALLRRLGVVFDPNARDVPPKPKWMRWPTYSRLACELRDVREAYTVALARDFYLMTGRDVSEGRVPQIVGGMHLRGSLRTGT